MELIDDEGKLFGIVNVIDALVVLFVLAIVIAGVAFVYGPEDGRSQPTTDTVHTTLDLGLQQAYLAEAINEGDTYSPGGVNELTITDVYVVPEGNGTHVVIRVALTGTPSGDMITYDGAPPRLGRALTIATERYQVDGRIRAIAHNDELPTESTTVILHGTVDATAEDEPVPGDRIRAAGRTVGTIDEVIAYPTNDPGNHNVYVQTTVEALAGEDGSRSFGDTPIRRGQELTLSTADYTLTLPIERVGTLDDMGTESTRTVTLQLTNVRESYADSIRPGLTERAGNRTTARITDVEVEPSLLILQGDDANIGVYQHPIERDVTITAELTVRESPSGPTFKGEPLRVGEPVSLDLGTVTVRATVVGLE